MGHGQASDNGELSQFREGRLRRSDVAARVDPGEGNIRLGRKDDLKKVFMNILSHQLWTRSLGSFTQTITSLNFPEAHL